MKNRRPTERKPPRKFRALGRCARCGGSCSGILKVDDKTTCIDCFDGAVKEAEAARNAKEEREWAQG